MDIPLKSSELNYNQIRKAWYYRMNNAVSNSGYRQKGQIARQSSSNSVRGRTQIPTLEQWLEKFIGLPRKHYYAQLKLIWFDVKVSITRYVTNA